MSIPQAQWNATLARASVSLQENMSYATVGIFLCSVAAVSYTVFANSEGKDAEGVPRKAGVPILGSWGFFAKRHNFVADGIARLGNFYYFKVLSVS